MLGPAAGNFAAYENLLAHGVIGESSPGFSSATPACRISKTAAKKEREFPPRRLLERLRGA